MNYAALRYAIEQAPVEGAAWQVLVVIAYRADRHSGESYGSVRTLAREARVSRSTVERVLTDLLRRGMVAIVLAGSGRRAACYAVVGHLSSGTTIGTQGAPSVPTTGTDGPSRVPTIGTQPESVVSRSEPRSVPMGQPVVSRWEGQPYKEGREELEGLKGAADTPSPNGAVGRSDPDRCRHRNDPATCAICSDVSGVAPSSSVRSRLDQALGRVRDAAADDPEAAP